MHSSCTKGGFWVKLLFGICASHPRVPSNGKCVCIARTFSVGLLKLYLSCPEDTIGEKRFSKNLSISSFLDCQQKFLGCLGEIPLAEKSSLLFLTLSHWLSGYGSRGNFWRKNIFANKIFFHQFPTFSFWFSGFWQNTGRVIKTAFYVSRGKFRQEAFFEKRIFISFGIAAEKDQTFNRIFCHGCQIFLPRVQKKKLLREQKLEKKEYSIRFSGLREKVSKFCKIFQQSLQNCVLPIQSINSSKNYSWNVVYLRGFSGLRARRFGLFAKSILLEKSGNRFTCSKLRFGTNFSLKIGLHIPNFKRKRFGSIVKLFGERCQNYIPRVHNILSENNVFGIIYQLFSFRTLSVIFLDVWWTFFGWFAKTAFSGSREKFWRQKVFLSISDFELLILEYLAEKSWTGNQNCFVRVETIFLAKIFLRKKFLFITFGRSARTSGTFGRKVLPWLSNLPSTCPEEQSERRKTREKVNSNHFWKLERSF